MIRYTPDIPVEIRDLPTMLSFVVDEFTKISTALNGTLPERLVEQHAAPSKPRDFLIVAADGTDWNPGSGQGVYCYYAAAWHFLG